MTWAIVLQESGKLIGMINIGSDEYNKVEVGTVTLLIWIMKIMVI